MDNWILDNDNGQFTGPQHITVDDVTTRRDEFEGTVTLEYTTKLAQ